MHLGCGQLGYYNLGVICGSSTKNPDYSCRTESKYCDGDTDEEEDKPEKYSESDPEATDALMDNDSIRHSVTSPRLS